MNAFLQQLVAFGQTTSIWVYLFIFFGKIIEVAFATLRIVLINRGERAVGSLVAIFEVTLWLLVTGTVLIGFQNDWVKIVVYAAAFAIGNYIGSWLDEKLAFGLSAIQIVAPDAETTNSLLELLRSNGFGVTMIDAHGVQDDRQILMLTLKRKQMKEALALVESLGKNCVVTISDVKAQSGAYMRNYSKRSKAK